VHSLGSEGANELNPLYNIPATVVTEQVRTTPHLVAPGIVDTIPLFVALIFASCGIYCWHLFWLYLSLLHSLLMAAVEFLSLGAFYNPPTLNLGSWSNALHSPDWSPSWVFASCEMHMADMDYGKRWWICWKLRGWILITQFHFWLLMTTFSFSFPIQSWKRRTTPYHKTNPGAGTDKPCLAQRSGRSHWCYYIPAHIRQLGNPYISLIHTYVPCPSFLSIYI
jgi:hypothetical protein